MHDSGEAAIHEYGLPAVRNHYAYQEDGPISLVQSVVPIHFATHIADHDERVKKNGQCDDSKAVPTSDNLCNHALELASLKILDGLDLLDSQPVRFGPVVSAQSSVASDE